MVVLSGSVETEGIATGRLIGMLATIPLIYLVETRFLRINQLRFWSDNLSKLLAVGPVRRLLNGLGLRTIQRPGLRQLVDSQRAD